jgi:hypothetical protein
MEKVNSISLLKLVQTQNLRILKLAFVLAIGCTCLLHCSHVFVKSLLHHLLSVFLLIGNLITLMNGLSSPNILDYLDDDGEDIDLMAYDEAEKDYLEKKRRIVQPILSKKKPYQPRRQYRRRNPRDSIWYIDYVIDIYDTWKDL